MLLKAGINADYSAALQTMLFLITAMSDSESLSFFFPGVTLGPTLDSERHRLCSKPLRLTGRVVTGGRSDWHNDERRFFILRDYPSP